MLSTPGIKHSFVEQLFRTSREEKPIFAIIDSCPPHLRVGQDFPTDEFLKTLSEKITKQVEQMNAEDTPDTINVGGVIYHREKNIESRSLSAETEIKRKELIETLRNLTNGTRYKSKPHSTNDLFCDEINEHFVSYLSTLPVSHNAHVGIEHKKQRDNQKKADFKKSPLDRINGKKKPVKLSKFFSRES